MVRGEDFPSVNRGQGRLSGFHTQNGRYRGIAHSILCDGMIEEVFESRLWCYFVHFCSSTIDLVMYEIKAGEGANGWNWLRFLPPGSHIDLRFL
jgi:hypothetical protein